MSELRQDIISGDWVILAPERGKRPILLKEKKRARVATPKSRCPFEDLERSANTPLALYPGNAFIKKGNWKIAVIPNKYPVLMHPYGGTCSIPIEEGVHRGMTGVGIHWLVVTRDHNKNFAALDAASATQVLATLQDCHRKMAEDQCVRYAASIFNWGPQAGATEWHPHYQVLALPIVPAHVAHSLRGAEEYFKKHHRCGRCDVIKTEKKEKVRVVMERANAIAIVPYAAKKPFEIAILPRRHSPSFRNESPAVLRDVAAILQGTMKMLKKNAHDPDLNMFIHDSPIRGGAYPHHHWHIELMPHVASPAGFELSTGIEINSLAPETAATILRRK